MVRFSMQLQNVSVTLWFRIVLQFLVLRFVLSVFISLRSAECVFILLQPLRRCCVDCVIHQKRDVREEQHHTYMRLEQAIIQWSWHVNSIVACCHSAKLCAYDARDFWSQQNGAVTRMWRSCGVQPSHKERAIGAVRCKKEGCCCNLSGGVALIVWFTRNGMCVKNNTIHICGVNKQ